MQTVPAQESLARAAASAPPRVPVNAADYLRQVAMVGFFFAGALVVSPACWLLWRVAGRWIAPEDGQRLVSALFRFFIHVLRAMRVIDLDAGDLGRFAGRTGTIFAANHPGYLDAVFLIAFLPNARCVMRASLLRNPFFAGPALLAGYLRNDSGAGFVREGAAALRAGGNLVVFPEGTRTDARRVRRFKAGFALIARKASAPIQTLFIERQSDFLAKGVSLLRPESLPVPFRVTAGQVFRCGDGESARAFAGRLEAYFQSELVCSGPRILRRPAGDPRAS